MSTLMPEIPTVNTNQITNHTEETLGTTATKSPITVFTNTATGSTNTLASSHNSPTNPPSSNSPLSMSPTPINGQPSQTSPSTLQSSNPSVQNNQTQSPVNTKPNPPAKRVVSRRACLSCRERKIKCEGIENCKNCRNLQLKCVYVKSHRGGSRRNKVGKNQMPTFAVAPASKGVGVGTVATGSIAATGTTIIDSKNTMNQVVIAELQHQIDTLQKKMNEIKDPYLGPGFIDYNISEELPSKNICILLIDLYFEYFHPNHCFLMPKSYIMNNISGVSEVIFFAMFSISCRFLKREPEKVKKMNVPRYCHDPNYWISKFDKRKDELLSCEYLVKGLLLVGMSYSNDTEFEKSLQISDQLYQITLWNNLHRKYSRNAEISNLTNKEDLAKVLSPTQRMFRESMIRTIWEIWRFRVQCAIFYDNPYHIPPFNGDKCLPVSDQMFNEGLTNWSFDRKFWSDLDEELTSDSQSLPPGSSMAIFCVHLLSLSFQYSKAVHNENTFLTLESRIRSSFNRLPGNHSSLAGEYFMPYLALYAAELALHSSKARPCLILSNSASEKGHNNHYGGHNLPSQLVYSSPVSLESLESYYISLDTSLRAHNFLTALPNPEKMSPVNCHLLQQSVTFIGNQVLYLQYAAKSSSTLQSPKVHPLRPPPPGFHPFHHDFGNISLNPKLLKQMFFELKEIENIMSMYWDRFSETKKRTDWIADEFED